jgi:cobalt/nickel transport system ATP-binding protein
MSPRIITLDEPDGSLDPRNRDNLMKPLRSLHQTLIIATCNMNFAASVADQAVLLDNGRIIADGEAKEIMSDIELMTKHGLEIETKK